MRLFITKLRYAGLVLAALTAAAQEIVPSPALTPKAIKEIEAIASQRFSRDPSELLRHLERVGTVEPETLNLTDRFLLRFVTGDWNKLHQELTQMPPELSRRIYDKMLADLTSNRKPNIRLEDVIGIADAVPGELTSDNLRRLGQLLSLAVPLTESYWIEDRLKKGTSTLGGSDPSKRLNAARVLIAGNFKDLARAFLPSPAEIEQIQDEDLKNELHSFLATQEEREKSQRDQVMRVWDESIGILLNPSSTKQRSSETSRATNSLVKILTQVPRNIVASALAELIKTNPEGGLHLVSAFTRKVQGERNADPAVRTENLAAQAAIANLLTGLVDPSQQPWKEIFELMADHWTSEADNSYQQQSAKNQRFVPPEELLTSAPGGKWLDSLTPAVRDRIDVSMSRLILTGAQFDQAAERIVEIGKRSPAAGAALAGEFLAVWGRVHSPQLPEEMRKRYGLPEDARIPVTPMMMEKNIDSLARMMSLFREAGLLPPDYSRVVAAFDLAYSTAEAYRTSHIEKVFGPMAQMEEKVFLLILSRMNANLGERWRKLDVQRVNLTRRDEAQTLEMVRNGYGTALQMIDAWLKSHPDSWRAHALAGMALVDWGDFEYFQQLAATDPNQRMFGFREKNLQAQEYFDRSAAAYGRQLPKLSQADYTVEPFLAWFHAILGIGSNNQLNLSKPVNRAALGKIREYLLALPGKAAKEHMSLFAKTTNARLNDEKEPLHEDLKYRYLASALVITKDDPFTLGVAKRLTYYDELLSEVRLQTRVDGPNTVGRKQDFGVILSMIHTEAMGRAAKFGQYLSNDSNAAGSKSRWRQPHASKMNAAQGARDELELNLREALNPFFDIQSITFATPDVKPRPTARAGWEETVLAYMQLRAKDSSVDKIPPVEMQLKFVDMTGPVSIPAESAETVIKVATDGAPARPASHIDLTQTLDARQLLINGTLSLEIKATASGLVPELEQLLDFDPKAPIGVKSINPHGGLQVKELNTWADEVAPTSERLWTVALDGDAIRAAGGPLDFHFPALKDKSVSATYQSYQDMDLVRVDQPVVTLGQRSEEEGEVVAQPASHAYFWILGVFVVGGTGTGLWWWRARKRARERPPIPGEGFQVPVELDGFAAVILLRKFVSNPAIRLTDSQRQELQLDLQRIEQSCFGKNGGMRESDLRSVATKWLNTIS